MAYSFAGRRVERYSAGMPVRLAAILLLSLFLGCLSPARAGDVAVLLSDGGGVYAEFSGALRQYLDGSPWRLRWVGAVEMAEGMPRTDLVVAVGSEAVRTALRRGGPPVVATLLPRQAWEKAMADSGRPRASATAIWLDQPPARLLAFTRHLLPERRRVGLLAGPETRNSLAPLRQAAAAAGMTLDIEETDSEASPLPALNHLLSRSDVLLALPDPAIYRRDNIRAILLTSYRFQKPLIGFSQAMVTAGALAALYSTPLQIARQTADLLQGLPAPAVSLPPPQAPASFAIGINGNVAQSLGLQVPDEATLRRLVMGERDPR